MCAKPSLTGSAIVIYPDTLIRVDDNFDKNSSHMIPGVINKIHEAKKKNLFWS